MTATTPALSDVDLREQVTAWLRENLPAGWMEAIDASDEEKLRAARAGLGVGDFLERLGASGWGSPTWPAEYAGRSLEPSQARIVNDVLSHYKVPRSFNIIGIGMGGPTIIQWGTEEQKKRYLLPMIQNKEIWCQLFSEPGNGSDAANASTRAVRDGDEWLVNGQKVWTTLAHISKFGLLLARTNPDVPKHKGLSYFIVDMQSPGVEVRPLKQITGDAEFNEVFFTDVRIPDANRLGPEGEGWGVATTTLMNERVALSGLGSLGGGENVGGGPVEGIIRDARAAGLYDDPVVRDRLMRVLIESRVLKMTNFRAAAARKAGRAPGPEGSVTKLFAAEHNQRVQNLAVDVLGPKAMAWDSSSNSSGTVRGFLRSRANTIEGGTSEIMRRILGDRVLGLPREPDISADIPWKDVAHN